MLLRLTNKGVNRQGNVPGYYITTFYVLGVPVFSRKDYY